MQIKGSLSDVDAKAFNSSLTTSGRKYMIRSSSLKIQHSEWIQYCPEDTAQNLIECTQLNIS